MKDKWHIELINCRHILRYLSTYPEVLQEMEIGKLLEPDKAYDHFCSWQNLVAQYQGLEADFYKDYWFPIEADNYQFFIDLSKPELPVIETIYVMGKKHEEEYISSILFSSVSDFFLLIEKEDELSQYFEKHLMLKYFNYLGDIEADFSNPF